MKTTHLIRSALFASCVLAFTHSALAEGDIYSRLAKSRAEMMAANDARMVTKAEYLEYVSAAWDMKAADMKVKDAKMTHAQLKELEKELGRMVTY